MRAIASEAEAEAPAEPGFSKPESLRERIYLDLRRRLQRCEIGPNDRLVDTEIAAAYGASRMPAREALMRLVHEGYLVGTTRGFVIPALSLADVLEIFEIRRLLEPRAAALAARDLTPAAAAALEAALADARRAAAAEDVEGLILANIAFRAAWLGAVRNARLAATIARFADQVQMVRLATLRHAPTRRVVLSGLERLQDAFRRRDPLAAADRMAEFVAAAEHAFLALHAPEAA
jgi:DNA-binding GntR family transcriptional regulator